MCMIDWSDDDWVNFPSVTRRARKDWTCYECSRAILTGEHYEDARAAAEGTIYEMRTCAHCVAARRWLELVCRGWLWGAVWQDLQEHWDEEAPPIRSLDLGRLIQWRERRFTTSQGLVDPLTIRVIAERSGTRTMEAAR